MRPLEADVRRAREAIRTGNPDQYAPGVGIAWVDHAETLAAALDDAEARLTAQQPSLIDQILAVMPEDARAHWDTMDDERQRWGSGVCRCYLCDALIAARDSAKEATR